MGASKHHGQAERRLTVTAARLLPNAITLLRLATVPATVWLIARSDLSAAFWLFAAAGASDALDGALARMLRAQSVLGSYLDALADKVLLVSVYLSLGSAGLLWGWLVAVVVCRDLLLSGFAVFMRLTGARRGVEPLLVSKINTAAQIALAAVVLGHRGLGWFSAGMVAPLSLLVAATTTFSLAAYWVAWSRRGLAQGFKREEK